MRLIIDSDMAKLPNNCHECPLGYGGWCFWMPAEIDERCPEAHGCGKYPKAGGRRG